MSAPEEDEAVRSRAGPQAAAGPGGALEDLIAVMARLRDPQTGCPWDLEQTFATIAPYTLEEAYEVADAVARNDLDELREELGDLLLQVVFHARMAQEAGAFSFADVARAITEKMRRRHPHVFGTADIRSAQAQTSSWESIKTAERAARGRTGVLDGVPLALPALTRALKLSQRAARVGFVWPTTEAVLDKVREELAETEAEIVRGDAEAVKEEIGDLLFVVANLARDQGVDPEEALRGANAKFERRFAHVERALAAAGREPASASLEEMERHWNEVRALDKAARPTASLPPDPDA